MVSASMQWHELHWPRPLDEDRALGLLRTWAADSRSPQLTLEARATAEGVRYLFGMPASYVSVVLSGLHAHMPGMSVVPKPTRSIDLNVAVRLRASTRHRPLRVDDVVTVVRSTLSGLTRVRASEELVVQLVLGPRRVPLAIPTNTSSATVASVWEVAWHGNGKQLDGEKRSALRSKVGDHGFACTIRLGVRAAPKRQRSLVAGLFAGIRTSEAASVRFNLRREPVSRLNRAQPPTWRWPLRLNCTEILMLTAWPIGDEDLPGQAPAHPVRLRPVAGTDGNGRNFASAAAPGCDARIGISASNALHHSWVLGPTGSGKSNLLGRLIEADVRDGRAVVVIEPKGDLVDDVLLHLPPERRDDVVVLDPIDVAPVGLNPLASAGRRPEIVADSLLAVFRQLYGDAIGPRSADILYASLLTLAHRHDASLVMLPLLLTNDGFRRTVTAGIHDPIALEPFWAAFNAWSEGERASAIAPVMNKLRPLLRPTVRAVLGQQEPRFSLRQVFSERKIFLLPLRRGLIGPEAASLIGSLALAELWQATQERSAAALSKRHPVMVYVDEVQDYLHLGTDLGDALAQARGYGVGFHLAHQFVHQLPPEMRAAIATNARSRIGFQLAHADAVELSKGHSEISPEDFMALGQYEIYASVFTDGRVTPYAYGKTVPPGKALSSVDQLRRASRQRYGRPVNEIGSQLCRATAERGAGPRRDRPPSEAPMTIDDQFPIDPPFASSRNGFQTPQNVPQKRLVAGNTPRETRTRSRSERVSRDGLAALGRELSDRDWAVLRSVADHRFLTTPHLQTLHFTAHASAGSATRTCRLVMSRLQKQRLVRNLDRRIGGYRAGSASYVWTTDVVGRRLLDSDEGRHHRRHHEPSERFLYHALAIADVHLALLTAHRRSELELLSVDLEPQCWRPYTASAGNRAVLQPDLAVTTGAGDYEDAWFVEVDLGTEHLPTLLKKCAQYEAYRRTGIEQERFGSFPWVIWLLSTDHRVLAFNEALDRTRTIDRNLFKIATFDGLVPLITNNNQLKGGDHA